MLITFVPHKCSKRVDLVGPDQTDLETLFSDGRAVLLTDALDQQRISDNRFVLQLFLNHSNQYRVESKF